MTALPPRAEASRNQNPGLSRSVGLKMCIRDSLIDRFGYWKDSGIRLEGEGVWGLTAAFLNMWSFLGGELHAVSYTHLLRHPKRHPRL